MRGVLWRTALIVGLPVVLILFSRFEPHRAPATDEAAGSASARAAALAVRAPRVTLDSGTGVLRIEVTVGGLARVTSDTLWVWAYVVHTAEGRMVGRSVPPIPVERPTDTDTAVVVAMTALPLAMMPRALLDSYRAHVRVAADSTSASLRPAAWRDDLSAMTPVTVVER